MTEFTLYGYPECPVCADAGALVCVFARFNERLIFTCPVCGVAWSSLPKPYVLDEVQTLEELAPTGISLPSALQIRGAGLELDELDPQWLEYFDSVKPHSQE